jgi:hypothetical protein
MVPETREIQDGKNAHPFAPWASRYSPSAQSHVGQLRMVPRPGFVRRSPFTVRRSPFAVHRSPFTVHDSPFTVRRSRLLRRLNAKRTGRGRPSLLFGLRASALMILSLPRACDLHERAYNAIIGLQDGFIVDGPQGGCIVGGQWGLKRSHLE